MLPDCADSRKDGEPHFIALTLEQLCTHPTYNLPTQRETSQDEAMIKMLRTAFN